MGIFLNIIIYIIIFLMGITVFSYLNYVIAHLPKGESMTAKRSSCPYCGHEQDIWDVLPVVSRIRNQGRCRYCGTRLPVRELLIEVLGGALAVLSVVFYGISLQAMLVFLVMCDLTVITFIDADTQEIPPVLNYILLGLGVVSIWIMGDPGIVERLIGMVSVSLPMLLLILLFNGFGGGDVKLMFAAGFLLGWKGTVAAFLIGAVAGGIYGIYLLVSKKKGRKEYFAFGPFLSVGIAVSLIQGFGSWMVQSYIDYLKGLMTFM
ncbi:MAG: prepilin peptidase [Wujia sp.]